MKQGWEIKQLGDISRIMYGYTAKANPNPAKAKYLRITDIQNNLVDWNSVPNCDLTDDEFFKYQLQYGDIVFARTGATTGKSFLVSNPPDAVFASYLIRVQTNLKQVLPEFLNQFFQTSKYWNEINKGISGSAQGGFNATKLRELEIPFPPLDEQKHIVAKLDECFEATKKARANVEKNLRKTEELHQSLLFQILYQDSEKWEKSILGESCEFFNGKAHEKTREQMFPLFKNDIVMVMSDVPNGKALAKCYLIEKDNTYSLNQRICAIRSENYIHKYLFYQLNRHRHLLSFNNGENQTNLRKNDILNTPLYIPPFDDQEEVVKKLDEVVSQTKSLESNYQQELDALDELKKSILQKAFNGEL